MRIETEIADQKKRDVRFGRTKFRIIYLPGHKGKKNWFIHYGKGRNTGGFLTKKDAQSWYDKGGR